MPETKGWVRTSNELYAAQLREEDRKHKERVGKNRGQMCDYCATGDHERCWRVVCYCPCVSNKEWYNGWPNTQSARSRTQAVDGSEHVPGELSGDGYTDTVG